MSASNPACAAVSAQLRAPPAATRLARHCSQIKTQHVKP